MRGSRIPNEAAPFLIQTRIQLGCESRDMLGFQFVSDDALVVDDKALAKPQGPAGDVLDAGIKALRGSALSSGQDHWETLKTATPRAGHSTARDQTAFGIRSVARRGDRAAGLSALVRVHGDPWKQFHLWQG